MLLKKPGQDFVPMINLLLSAILQPPFRTDPYYGHNLVCIRSKIDSPA